MHLTPKEFDWSNALESALADVIQSEGIILWHLDRPGETRSRDIIGVVAGPSGQELFCANVTLTDGSTPYIRVGYRHGLDETLSRHLSADPNAEPRIDRLEPERIPADAALEKAVGSRLGAIWSNVDQRFGSYLLRGPFGSREEKRLIIATCERHGSKYSVEICVDLPFDEFRSTVEGEFTTRAEPR